MKMIEQALSEIQLNTWSIFLLGFIFLNKREYLFIIENLSISCEAAYKLSRIRNGLPVEKNRNA